MQYISNKLFSERPFLNFEFLILNYLRDPLGFLWILNTNITLHYLRK